MDKKKSFVILEVNKSKDYTLIAMLNDTKDGVKSVVQEHFVVAWKFDHETCEWCQGHYFEDLLLALQFIRE